MARLIFDIETIGEDFEQMDKTSQHMLTRWIEKTTKTDDEFHSALTDLKNNLGFNPLTGQIVAIGVLDGDTDSGAVYFDALSEKHNFQENNIKFKSNSEKEMLEKFWELSTRYNEFITFNGRCFDVPFLMIRSAIHKIRPAKNLLSNRYINSQKYDANHIDLFDQLTFYGAFRPKGYNLHMFMRAFGLESPKANGVDGDQVAELFKEKKYQEIAKYNAADIKATKKLYEIWRDYIKV